MSSVARILALAGLLRGAAGVYLGTNVSMGTYPNFATLLYVKNGGTYICGGWLADPRHVVTAAHCVGDDSGNLNAASQYYVYFNKVPTMVPFQPQPSYVASALFAHPLYGSTVDSNDVGVVRLAADVPGISPWSYLKTDSLPSVTECTLYTLIGHGQTCDGGCLSDTLQRTTMPKLNNVHCQQSSLADTNLWPASVIGTDVCFGHVPPCSAGFSTSQSHACAGDSGGPAFDASGTVAALVSRGSSKPCTQTTMPDIYTSIGHITNADWIASTLAAAYVPPSPPPPPQPPVRSSAPVYYIVSSGVHHRLYRLFPVLVCALALL